MDVESASVARRMVPAIGLRRFDFEHAGFHQQCREVEEVLRERELTVAERIECRAVHLDPGARHFHAEERSFDGARERPEERARSPSITGRAHVNFMSGNASNQ